MNVNEIENKDKEDYKKFLAHNVAEMIVNRYEVLGPDIKETYDQIFNSALDTTVLSEEDYEDIYQEVDSLLDAHIPKLIIATRKGEPIYLAEVEVYDHLKEGE